MLPFFRESAIRIFLGLFLSALILSGCAEPTEIELPISITQAALGDNIEIPTLNGRAKLKIPSGTQSGKIFRMRAKGIRHLYSSGSGDQLVRVWVWTPTNLGRDEKNILEELQNSPKMKPPKGGKSFLKYKETY